MNAVPNVSDVSGCSAAGRERLWIALILSIELCALKVNDLPPDGHLELWKHLLVTVPDFLWESVQLETLVLADNGLTEVSAEIGRLTAPDAGSGSQPADLPSGGARAA